MNAYRPFLLTLSLCALMPAQAEQAADVQPFTQCRGIADAAGRLSCYDAAADALSRIAAVSAPTPVPAATTVTVTATDPAPTVPTPTQAAAPETHAADFGAETLPKSRAEEATGAPDEIHSRILGDFRGWEAKTRFELENGQVWECVNCRAVHLLKQDPEVTIKRGFISGYWLKIEGLNTQAAVRRIK